MNILLAPDKFKGSLSAKEVCASIQQGMSRKGEEHLFELHPMADGGDGSIEILSNHLELKPRTVPTLDPLGRPLVARYFHSTNAAFIELASASGLVLLQEGQRNPLLTSTRGTGLMIKDAINQGFSQVYLFLGGSATNDAGMGIAHELGFRFYNGEGKLLAPTGENLGAVDSIGSEENSGLKDLRLTLLCDVTNPLTGDRGAANVYAKQKGGSPEQIERLELGMIRFSNLLERNLQHKMNEIPGSGAAGGVGASLIALLGAELKGGFQTVAELTGLEEKFQHADLVISGEGKLDSQSFHGKVVHGINELCKKYHKPLILFVGKSDLSTEEIAVHGIRSVSSVFEKSTGLSDAMANAAKYLEQLGEECDLFLMASEDN